MQISLQFILEGAAAVSAELRARGIRVATHVARDKHRQKPACSLAFRASVVIAEEAFCAPYRAGLTALAGGRFSAPIWVVDADRCGMPSLTDLKRHY